MAKKINCNFGKSLFWCPDYLTFYPHRGINPYDVSSCRYYFNVFQKPVKPIVVTNVIIDEYKKKEVK
jgi:hypothetical protein